MLAGGVAQVSCGAATDTEMKERKAMLKHSLAAMQAALAEGIVPGGGVALLRSAEALNKLELEGDEGLGVEIIRKVLDYPLRYIAENAGVDGAVVANRVRQTKGKNEGYNAAADKYCDMVEAGVIDPAKVVRTSLNKAASVATLLLTSKQFCGDRDPVGERSRELS